MRLAVGGVAASPAVSWRWPAAFAAVLLLHAAAVALLQGVRPAQPPDSPAEAILLDLAPATPPATPAPPEAAPAPEPPVPQARVPEPEMPESLPPPPAIATPPAIAINPDVVLPPPARPRPIARPPAHPAPAHPAPTRPLPAPAAPPASEARVNPEPVRHAPPEASPPAPSSAAAAATWASTLAAHLRQYRRYPPDALRRNMTGVVMMRFSIDAAGHVVAAAVVRSSGHESLDQEAEAWLRRAQPLPAPPPDRVAPAQIVVPLSFELN